MGGWREGAIRLSSPCRRPGYYIFDEQRCCLLVIWLVGDRKDVRFISRHTVRERANTIRHLNFKFSPVQHSLVEVVDGLLFKYVCGCKKVDCTYGRKVTHSILMLRCVCALIIIWHVMKFGVLCVWHVECWWTISGTHKHVNISG